MNKPDVDDPAIEGKIIQEHLENINMDPWYYIYQVYVNPPCWEQKKDKRLGLIYFGKFFLLEYLDNL